MYAYLAWISKEKHMNPDVFVCLILVSYIGTQGWCGDDVVAPPPHIQMRSLSSTSRFQTQLNSLTLSPVLRLTFVRRAKNTLLLYGV
jgi:hypothetical protein